MSIQTKAAGFNETSATYERGRPEYPDEALRFTFEALGIDAASTVVDLGAGSGKFTGKL
ncbi:MAG: SAM-dependent methyltransferase, partial [Burkholderiaceae bacterium]|nr:SAM-dependent methyltransferase [Burkholderiaceae bacterium]